MKISIRARHQDMADINERLAPLSAEIGKITRSSLPAFVQLHFECDDVMAARVYQALGYHEWDFDGTTFSRKPD